MSKFTRKLTSSVAPIVNTPGVWTVNERTQNATALVITSIVVCDSGYNELDDTAVGTTGGYLKIKGTGFLSTATVYLNGVLITPTVTSSLELRIIVPTLTVGTYSLIVFNTAAVGAIWAAGLVVSGVPVWSTTTIATANLTVNTQLVATGDATLVYTLASGSLPPGITLSSGGLLSGTISPVPSVNTVYNFTVDVKDAQNQNLAQAITFSLSVDYFIAKSLRFRSSANAYLSRTPATATNRTTWTWSAWVKRGTLGTYPELFTAGVRTSPNPEFTITFEADALRCYPYDGSSAVFDVKSTALYRDPAAWYHVIVAFDTTQATAADRVKFYVNGQQITSFATASYPTQNSTWPINSVTPHQISGSTYAAQQYFDGEMAEVNFVDGQALAPTAFGAYSTYNQWLPKAYTGTYGTNGFYLPFNSVSTSSYAGYFIGGSNSLTTTATQIIPATGDFTIEAMVHLSNLGTYPVICAQGTLGGAGRTVFYVSSAGGVSFASDVQGVSSASGLVKVYNWYYIAVTRSGANLTLYINGVSVATNSVTMGSIQNTTLAIGTDWGGDYFNGGYVSNFRISTVVRTIAIPTAPFVNDASTKFLTLQSSTAVDNSSNAYAITNNGSAVFSVQYPFSTAVFNDVSGNANHWIPPSYAGSSNNISLIAGSTYDSLTDVPTLTSTTVANYAVLNPLSQPSTGTMSDANSKFTFAAASSGYTVKATQGMTTGKFYWETTVASWATNGPLVGYCLPTSPKDANTVPGNDATPTGGAGILVQNNVTYIYVEGTYTNITGQVSWATSGDIVGIAYDADTGKAWVRQNGNAWLQGLSGSSGNPVTGTNPSWTSSTGKTQLPAIGGSTSAVIVANFGQRPFTYTPPANFLALNTYNI